MRSLKSNQNIIINKSLLFVKAFWCSRIIFGKIFFSLLAKNFKKILYKTLHKLIGLNSETNSGLLTLGMSMINNDYNYLGVLQSLEN